VKPLADQDHYEILEIPRGASATAIERAYRLARSTFADDSLALYSVVDPRDAEAIRLRVEEAYRVLSDPTARRAYDATLGDAPAEAQTLPIQFDAEPVRAGMSSGSPGAVGDLAPGERPTRYDGAAFRAARLRHALDLDQIADITKVNPRYLRYIEEERIEGLPARVYVRGFVEAYSRVVGFDPGDSVASYMEIYDQGAPSSTPRRARFLGP
jgi:flagellar biosynthesis protein FlhG